MPRSRKSFKKIQGLIFLMLITVILGITATYAWFSTQRDVEIAGMRLNVEVAESMQISLDGEKWTQSIQIADMRQFYGTYNETGSEGFAVFQAKDVDEGGNLNYVPTELLPVSTAGEVSNGKLKFAYGTLETETTGIQILSGITACSETDIISTAEIETKEQNNESHPYLVFDMYLRNISAKTEGIDELLLNAGSSVFVNTASTDNEQQEGKGVAGTGLEYSARVGMIIYGNTVSVTAKDTASQTIGEQIRGITPNNSELAAIWEPNYLEHTQYVVNNNNRGITSVSEAVETYGIKEIPGDRKISIGSDTSLELVKTFRTSYTTVTGGTDYSAKITNTEREVIGLAPNQISKVRVYIWLEGQDPDCVDMASTGDKLNVNLKLTKETNTIEENSYVREYISSSDYGTEIVNYEPENGVNDEGIKWRLFHKDKDNIYLIADTYVPLTNEAGDKNYVPQIAYNNTSGRYGFDLLGTTSNYTGTANISNDIAAKWLKQYTNAGYTASNVSDTGKGIAFLLDKNAWSGFKDDTYAEYSVGAPTLELLVESYMSRNDIKTKLRIGLENSGYNIEMYNTTYNMWVPQGYWQDEDDNKGLYGISDTFGDTIQGMWVASHTTNGKMYHIQGNFIRDWAMIEDKFGSRPIVCLKSNVYLERQEDGRFKIIN